MAGREASHEVVIVGGGIAGSALAAGLAQGGVDVLLLEKSETFADRVRGEAFTPWGVLEARRLGLEDALMVAGGHYLRQMIGYDEVAPGAAAEAAPVPMEGFAPDVPGMLTLPHPRHCQALFDAARAAGASVARGVSVTRVEAGATPSVEYEAADETVNVRARLVVGADGRPSSVRDALGVALHLDSPRTMLGGLMADGMQGWDSATWTLGTQADFCFAVFPMGDGRARVYGFWPVDQRHRFAGADGATRFLRAFDVPACPKGHGIADSDPGGPMLSFLNYETSADTPYVEGAVLVGDAGGWTDPIIGCGLASAYRDARLVRDILLSSKDWSARAFGGYAQERRERHRRLGFVSDIVTGFFGEFGEAGRARRRRFNEKAATDPAMTAHLVANLAGPESQPPEMFTPEHRAYLFDA